MINFTYNIFIEKFRLFALRHGSVRKFTYILPEDIDTEKDVDYPWMHVQLVNVSLSEGTATYNWDIKFFDLVRTKTNETAHMANVVSDMMLIARDLANEVRNGNNLFGNLADLVTPVNITELTNEYVNTLSGVNLNITIEVPYQFDACDLPADYPVIGQGNSSNFLTCASLAQCSTFSALAERVTDLEEAPGGGSPDWDDVQNKPSTFPPSNHTHPISDVTGLQSALDGKQANLGYTPEDLSKKGQADGYASLDESGKVPSAQLPSYVDDVEEYSDFGHFPVSGETGKIYVALDNGKIYRWSGSAFIEISPSPGSTDSVTEGTTNLYFTAARVLATLLTGLSTATNAVITASDTVLSSLGKLQKQISDNLTTLSSHTSNTSNPHSVTKSQVGLANADNTSDVNKPISTATQTALDGKSAIFTREIQAASFNPADGATLYYGIGAALAPMATTGGRRRIRMRRACTMYAISLDYYTTVAASNENVEFYVRVNNTTDYTITLTAQLTAGANVFNVIENASLNGGNGIPFAAGDYFEIKQVCPTWTTNPTGCVVQGCAEFR